MMIASKKVYRPSLDQLATLSFYKNNISHIFILYSLICESVRFIQQASKEEILKIIEMIYPIFAKDFHLKNEYLDSHAINSAIEVLIDKGLLKLDETANISSPKERDLNHEEYIALSNLCEPSLKRFYIAMSVIWNKDKISKEDFKDECKKIAENQEIIEGWAYPEFSDKAKFDNFLYMMINAKFFREDDEDCLYASKITKRAKKGYEQFFDEEFIKSIDKQLT